MAEGVTTRSKALEDTVTLLAKELKEVMATVQQHTEGMEQMQQTLSEFLQRMNPPSPTPPLLPTPTTYSSPTAPPPQMPYPVLPPLLPTPIETLNHHHLRLPKLEIPFFTGENVTGWLFQIDRFFLYHHIPTKQKLTIASFYMSGAALQWYQWMHATRQLATWEDFSRALELRFGPSSYVNHEAALYKLRQSSTMISYMNDFETLSTRTSGLTPTNLLNCFISGLRDDIRRELFLLKPDTITEAIGMAKLVEEKLDWSKHSFPGHRSTNLPLPPPVPFLDFLHHPHLLLNYLSKG